MKKLVSFFLLPILFLAITSCDLVKGPSLTTQVLVGTYEWQRTYGGIGGTTITPDSVNYTQKLVINDEAKAFLYRDDELMASYDIHFEKHEWVESQTWVFYPKSENFAIQYYIPDDSDLKEGELELRGYCYDCHHFFFKRSL